MAFPLVDTRRQRFNNFKLDCKLKVVVLIQSQNGSCKNTIYRGFCHRELISVKVKNFVLFIKKLSGKTYVCPEAATGGVLQKKVFLQIRKIHRKTPVLEILLVADLFYWKTSCKYHYQVSFIFCL